MIRKALLVLFGMLWAASLLPSFATPPEFARHYADKLMQGDNTPSGQNESVFDLGISRDRTLQQNVTCLFYPTSVAPSYCRDGTQAGGLFRTALRYIGFGILFFFLILTAMQFLLFPNDEAKIRAAGQSLLHIAYWSFLFFGVTWILGEALNIDMIAGGTDAVVDRFANTLMFQVLVFFKAIAFFMAIVFMVYYGFRMMQAMDKEEQIANARRGILNVIIALAFIKVVDYIFFIAQEPDFQSTATEFIVQVSVLLGRILGAVFMLAIFYAGFLMITSAGDEERRKQARDIIVAIFLSAIVIFMFLLLVYQIFANFS